MVSRAWGRRHPVARLRPSRQARGRVDRPEGEARFGGAGEGAVDEGERGAIDPVQFDCPERSMVWANVDVSFAVIEPPE
jgi:hypothetical protein